MASGAVLSVGGGLSGTLNEPIDLAGTGDGNGALQAVDAGTNVTFAGPLNLVADAGIGGTAHIAVSSAIAGSGGLTKLGSNRVNLSGGNTYSGLTTVASGTLSWERRRRTPCSTSAAPTCRVESWSSTTTALPARRRRSRAC